MSEELHDNNTEAFLTSVKMALEKGLGFASARRADKLLRAALGRRGAQEEELRQQIAAFKDSWPATDQPKDSDIAALRGVGVEAGAPAEVAQQPRDELMERARQAREELYMDGEIRAAEVIHELMQVLWEKRGPFGTPQEKEPVSMENVWHRSGCAAWGSDRTQKWRIGDEAFCDCGAKVWLTLHQEEKAK